MASGIRLREHAGVEAAGEAEAVPRHHPNRPSTTKAVQLAQDILQLHDEHTQELARCEAKIQDLMTQVDSLGDENRDLMAENYKLKAELGKRGGHNDDSVTGRGSEEDKAEMMVELKAEIHKLKAELDKRKAELDKSKAQAELGKATEKDVGKAVEEMTKEITELKAQLESKASANNELVKEIADLKTQMRSKADGHDAFCGFSSDAIFLQEKAEFIRFVQAIKTGGREGREYKQMYHFLLKCFTDADNNFDGRVGYLEFETLIDAAAFLPRRFGYAPSTPELYPTDFDRVKQRMKLFNGLKPRKAKALNKQSGTYDYISFDVWLQYAISHINEKALLLKDANPHSQMLGTQAEFQDFLLKACASRNSLEYKELYHVVLKCFVEVDTDMDGLIDVHGFNQMMDSSSIPPRLQGFLPDSTKLYESGEQKYEERSKLFRELDTNSGRLPFDTWLEYIYTFICKKATELGSAGVVPEIESAGTAKSEPKCPWRV